MAALGELDQALPERAHSSCPNCGRRELRAQYIGDPTYRIGYAAIWCDHCHWGAYTGRPRSQRLLLAHTRGFRWRGSGGARGLRGTLGTPDGGPGLVPQVP